MPIPTHGYDCETLLYRTACPDCHDEVYFFSCSCGSRVFFDLPEPPWNPHEDRCIPYLIRFLREVQRLSAASIRRLVEAYAQKRGLAVPPDIRRRLMADENRESGRTTVLEVLPNGSRITALGTIIEINKVNIFRRSGIPSNMMGRALLGRMADDAFFEVVIREDRDPESGFANQFTFFIPLRAWEASRLRLHNLALVVLKDHQLSVGKHIWMAESIERVTSVRRAN